MIYVDADADKLIHSEPLRAASPSARAGECMIERAHVMWASGRVHPCSCMHLNNMCMTYGC